MYKLVLVAALLTVLVNAQNGFVPPICPSDFNSFANTQQVVAKNYHLELSVDFKQKALMGYTHVSMTSKISNLSKITLDSGGLVFKSVALTIAGKQYTADYVVSSASDIAAQKYPADYGTPLTITVPSSVRIIQGQSFEVSIQYQTTNTSYAIQWLEPSQTAGKVHPYLYTQCESIFARTLFPCQDTPSNKATYSAKITTPKPLVAVMSAIKTGEEDQGSNTVYSYNQPVPVAAYLTALAVGALESKKIGPRSSIWSEKEMIDAGAYEFADTEKLIAAAETFLPKYIWGKYDLLLLPPSFPYGGMENPCLTFVTPTLLAGDRSLADVIAHEISHSWSGNLVTNKNWANFWLNEGFTMFIERRILARVESEDYAKFDAMLGYNSLQYDIQQYKSINRTELTKLIPDMDHVDPEDSFSTVPYEKGFNLLYYLANVIVGDNTKFEEFLFKYVSRFAYESITSMDMKAFFIQHFTGIVPQEKLNSIEWDKWFYTTGDVYRKNDFSNSLAVTVAALANRLIESGGQSAHEGDMKGWKSIEICYLLDTVAGSGKAMDIARLDSVYKLTDVKNDEIRFRWQMLSIKNKYAVVYPAVAKFLGEQGRGKFVFPLYQALNGVDHALAVATYQANKLFYQPLVAQKIAKELGL